MQPGDFNGDGKRDYYITGGIWGGDYMILAPTPGAMVKIHEGRLAGKEGLEHMVYRASARDIDDDGFTDLLTLMHYGKLSGDVAGVLFGAVLLRMRPGYQLDDELKAFWGSEMGFDEPLDRFGDFDGDGAPELVFAANLASLPGSPRRAATWMPEDRHSATKGRACPG